MKAITTLLLITLVISNNLLSQQQIQNPGFEEWEDVGLSKEEPTHWSSIKTSDNLSLNIHAPIVWDKSTDAHSGNYSLYLFNYYVSLISHVATGTISNGRFHADMDPDLGYAFTDPNNPMYHGVLTDKPDSVVGWYKCNPAVGDFGTIKFLLHTGYAAIPGDESNYIAMAYQELPSVEVNKWTRFSIPFVYTSGDTPEYFLSILTSGNGTQALQGSTAHFDDLKFIYNPSSINELNNNSFKVYQQKKLLKVEFDDNTNNYIKFVLMDLNGRMVFNTEVQSNITNSIYIDLLPTGIYTAKATSSNKSLTKKIHITN